jgi:hypothetical protein
MLAHPNYLSVQIQIIYACKSKLFKLANPNYLGFLNSDQIGPRLLNMLLIQNQVRERNRLSF